MDLARKRQEGKSISQNHDTNLRHISQQQKKERNFVIFHQIKVIFEKFNLSLGADFSLEPRI